MPQVGYSRQPAPATTFRLVTWAPVAYARGVHILLHVRLSLGRADGGADGPEATPALGIAAKGRRIS